MKREKLIDTRLSRSAIAVGSVQQTAPPPPASTGPSLSSLPAQPQPSSVQSGDQVASVGAAAVGRRASQSADLPLRASSSPPPPASQLPVSPQPQEEKKERLVHSVAPPVVLDGAHVCAQLERVLTGMAAMEQRLNDLERTVDTRPPLRPVAVAGAVPQPPAFPSISSAALQSPDPSQRQTSAVRRGDGADSVRGAPMGGSAPSSEHHMPVSLSRASLSAPHQSQEEKGERRVDDMASGSRASWVTARQLLDDSRLLRSTAAAGVTNQQSTELPSPTPVPSQSPDPSCSPSPPSSPCYSATSSYPTPPSSPARGDYECRMTYWFEEWADEDDGERAALESVAGSPSPERVLTVGNPASPSLDFRLPSVHSSPSSETQPSVLSQTQEEKVKEARQVEGAVSGLRPVAVNEAFQQYLASFTALSERLSRPQVGATQQPPSRTASLALLPSCFSEAWQLVVPLRDLSRDEVAAVGRFVLVYRTCAQLEVVFHLMRDAAHSGMMTVGECARLAEMGKRVIQHHSRAQEEWERSSASRERWCRADKKQ